MWKVTQTSKFIYFMHSEISGLLHNFFIFPLLTTAQTWYKGLSSESSTARSDLDSTPKNFFIRTLLFYADAQGTSEGSKGMCRHALSKPTIYKVICDLKIKFYQLQKQKFYH